MSTEIPHEIVEAARLIENWMKEQGIERWELMGICSRNHASIARMISRYVRHEPRCMKMNTPHSCNCGLKKLLELLK